MCQLFRHASGENPVFSERKGTPAKLTAHKTRIKERQHCLAGDFQIDRVSILNSLLLAKSQSAPNPIVPAGRKRSIESRSRPLICGSATDLCCAMPLICQPFIAGCGHEHRAMQVGPGAPGPLCASQAGAVQVRAVQELDQGPQSEIASVHADQRRDVLAYRSI